jgi:hypothetical protein
MLSPYRNNNHKKPEPAKIHFSDGGPFKRMNRMKMMAAWVAAIPNWMIAAYVPSPRKAVHKLTPVSATSTSQAMT